MFFSPTPHYQEPHRNINRAATARDRLGFSLKRTIIQKHVRFLLWESTINGNHLILALVQSTKNIKVELQEHSKVK